MQEAIIKIDITSLFRPNFSILAQQELRSLQNVLTRVNLRQGTTDEITWKWITTGIFIVKTAYTMLKTGPRIRLQASNIWKVLAPPRFKIFGWLAIQNKILTHDNLQRKGWTFVSRCLLCHAAWESTQHLFEDCPYTIQLYTRLIKCRP